jgi:hypothetical protein
MDKMDKLYCHNQGPSDFDFPENSKFNIKLNWITLQIKKE